MNEEIKSPYLSDIEQRGTEEFLFLCINEGDKPQLKTLLNNEECADSILQILLTKIYHNEDRAYHYDKDTILEAIELLGESVKNLNMLHVCCILGDEELALELLDFIHRITGELDSKKPMLEFVGRVWGDGNTVLHLASFMGLDQLVVRLIELGANTNKKNDRNYRPVDCVADEVMCAAFNTLPLEGYAMRRMSIAVSEPLRTKSIDDLQDGFQEEQLSDSQTLVSVPRRRRAMSVSTADVDMRKKVVHRPPSATSFIDKLRRKNGSDKNVRFDDMSMILFICQHGEAGDDSSLPVLRKATEDKSVISQLETGHQNLTPLHLACAYNQIKVVKYLLGECKVEVNSIDKEGWTPLHSACVEGHQEIVKLLGRCQGRCGEEGMDGSDSDWFYVTDGPINLSPLNDDLETPERLAKDKRLIGIVKIVQDLIEKYPKISQVSLNRSEYESDTNDTNSETELQNPDSFLKQDSFARMMTPLQRHNSTSAPKSSSPDRRKQTQRTLYGSQSSGLSSSDELDITDSPTDRAGEFEFPISKQQVAGSILNALAASTERPVHAPLTKKIEGNSRLNLTDVEELCQIPSQIGSNSLKGPIPVKMPLVMKHSSSFSRDMEPVKMSGKYISETSDHSTLSIIQSVDTVVPAHKFEAVKLPQTRVRAATLSPTRSNTFITSSQNSAPNVLNALQPKFKAGEDAVSPTFLMSNLERTYSQTKSTPPSVRSAMQTLGISSANPASTTSDIKRVIQESKSRIPTPVKMMQAEPQLPVKTDGTLNRDVSQIKQSMLDRIRNFEKQ